MRQSELNEQILAALIELEEKVEQMAFCRLEAGAPSQVGGAVQLLPIFKRIDDLAAELPPGADAQLSHYLTKKSYQKARLWLQGFDPEKGGCAR